MKVCERLVILFLLILSTTCEDLPGHTGTNIRNERNLKKNGFENFYKYLSKTSINQFKLHEDPARDKCLKSLIAEVIHTYGNTYVILADGKEHRSLIQNLQLNFIHSSFNNPKLLQHSEYLSFNNLQIFNKLKMKNILRATKPAQSTKFFCIIKDYNEVIKTFKQFWRHRLTNIVASILVNQTLYFYTYFPYSSTHCGHAGVPKLMAECGIANGIFIRKEKIFPKPSFNFHKCPVKITFKESIPSAYYAASGKLTGWEIELMNEIIEKMNGIPKYKILDGHTNPYTSSTGYSHLVRKSEIGGGMVVSLKGLIKTDYCMYGQSLCTIWVVPKQYDRFQSVGFILKVFPKSVWLLFLLAIFVTAGAFKLFTKSSYGTILFKLLAYSLGTTTRTKKTSRLLGGLWLWYCVTMTAIYQSGYQSTLLVPDLPHQLSSTREILNSDLKIMGVSDIITDVLPYLKARHNISRKRLKLLERKLSYDDWIDRMTVKKDSAFLGFKETAAYHFETTDWGDKLYVPQSCVVTYFLAFVLKKNSPLTESFMKISNRLEENGFVVYLYKKHITRGSKLNLPKNSKTTLKSQNGMDNTSPPSIDMDKILIVFLCLGAGCLLGLLTFIFELMSKRKLTGVKQSFKQVLTTTIYKKKASRVKAMAEEGS